MIVVEVADMRKNYLWKLMTFKLLFIQAWFCDVYGSDCRCLHTHLIRGMFLFSFLTLSHNPVPQTNIVFIYLFYALKSFQMKHKDRVLGLILVSPLCKAPSWSEWFYNKVISNLLYFYGMCGVLKEFLLQRYFSKVCWLQLPLLYTCCISLIINNGCEKFRFYCQQEVRGNIEIPESDIAQACRRVSVLLSLFF